MNSDIGKMHLLDFSKLQFSSNKLICLNAIDVVSEDEVKSDLSNKRFAAEQIAQLAPHKVHSGNSPSNTLILETLDAYHLGALIALYEHKIFVQGIIWQIYSFDQWGVQLGKLLASHLLGDMQSNSSSDRHDSSTNGLFNHIKSFS